mmetsp:Transcript_16480/g.27618  ORF Transcript_16480/g.27618 Transcript_16480/m.27618 type:complete len:207 (+) Transcript_16480:3588-4208(+)
MGLNPTERVLVYSLRIFWPLGPKTRSKCWVTDRSMGSSFLSGFEASTPYRATSCLVKEPQVHTDSAWMEIRAVVRVPVLSEHRMVIEEMSCRAGKEVTTESNSRAILPAPKAMVTCSTRGRATGMAAMMMDRQVSSRSLKLENSLRANPCTKKMTKTSAREMMMMIFTASSTRASNTDIFTSVLSFMMSALADPISVLMPVLRTMP